MSYQHTHTTEKGVYSQPATTSVTRPPSSPSPLPLMLLLLLLVMVVALVRGAHCRSACRSTSTSTPTHPPGSGRRTRQTPPPICGRRTGCTRALSPARSPRQARPPDPRPSRMCCRQRTAGPPCWEPGPGDSRTSHLHTCDTHAPDSTVSETKAAWAVCLCFVTWVHPSIHPSIVPTIGEGVAAGSHREEECRLEWCGGDEAHTQQPRGSTHHSEHLQHTTDRPHAPPARTTRGAINKQAGTDRRTG